MKIHSWNLAFMLFFALLVLTGANWLLSTGRIHAGISLGDFLLMALAIFRLIRLFTYDHITQFVRDWFEGKSERSLLGTMGGLIGCPWCTGLWFSFLVVFCAYATPLAWPIILILALASFASFIQVLSNWVGWNAAHKKHVVLEIDTEERL